MIAFGAFGEASTWDSGAEQRAINCRQDGLHAEKTSKNQQERRSGFNSYNAGDNRNGHSSDHTFNANGTEFLLAADRSQCTALSDNVHFDVCLGDKIENKGTRCQEAYRVPGGKVVGMFIIGSVGIAASALTWVLGFVPPAIKTGSTLFYESFLIIGIIVACSIPFFIMKMKKPSWKNRRHRNGRERITEKQCLVFVPGLENRKQEKNSVLVYSAWCPEQRIENKKTGLVFKI